MASPSRAPAGGNPSVAAEEVCELLEYPDDPGAPFIPSWTGWELVPDSATPQQEKSCVATAGVSGGKDDPLDEGKERAFAAGFARGIEEGRRQEREVHAGAHTDEEAQRIRQAAALLDAFAQERDRYMSAVEQEVVKLALAVAARILRREAQADPLLLMGAVRVALGQISGATEARLYVPAAELDLWTEALALLPRLAVKPIVLAGEGMRVGDCRIETALGWADLGLRAQLAEMDRALFGPAVATACAEVSR
jgi:flagellar assembly protein FliH